MNPNDTHREQLSALFDGALSADQSRFLLRRLQHDGELAASLSSWQLAGDVLRDQTDAPAPIGFAESIAARIAGEPLPLMEGGGVQMPARAATFSEVDAAARASVARGARWRWFGGGAMAASLAIASVLALRPETSPIAPTGFAVTESASPNLPPAPVVDVAPVTMNAVAASRTLATTPTTNRQAAALPAPSTVPRAASDSAQQAARRIARAAPAASTPDRDAEPIAPRIALPAESSARTAEARSSTPADPFTAPAAKPWPRAVIPSASSGTFNASLDSGTPYYPFTPNGAASTDQE